MNSPSPDFQLIFESVPNLYLILDPQLKIIAVTDSYAAATMVKREEIIGRYIFDVFPDNPHDPQATGVKNLRASLDAVLKTKKPDAMAIQKYDVRRPDPQNAEFEERYWSPMNCPVLGADKEIKYIIHHVEDVTHFIDLKNRLSTQNELPQTEIEIYQRAQEIQEQNKRLNALSSELEIMNQKLHASNEQLSEFVYIASHDLQEPLRTVGSYVQLLQKRYQGQLDKDADEFIHYAVEGVERMKMLIHDLLSYARIDTRGMPFRTVDMTTPLNWALSNLQDTIKNTRAKVNAMPLPHVLGDETQLGLLYQNLIGNALKYAEPTRPINIDLGVSAQEEGWEFYVRDNGIGIDPQFHEKVFKLFQRLHSREHYEGTGIGLAICKKIVVRHGGKIWVTSTLGEGTTFHFVLPKTIEEEK